jgi:ABC-type uncharacterized transport system ATPase subunit
MVDCRDASYGCTMTTPAIEAIDLVKRLGAANQRPAVDGVSFTVPQGTVLGLLGPGPTAQARPPPCG